MVTEVAMTFLGSNKWESFAVVAAGLLVASFFDNMIATAIDPILTNLKMAPYNG